MGWAPLSRPVTSTSHLLALGFRSNNAAVPASATSNLGGVRFLYRFGAHHLWGARPPSSHSCRESTPRFLARTSDYRSLDRTHKRGKQRANL